MNILLIDNGTLHLEKLKEWLGEHQVNVVKPSDDFDHKEHDLVILSGGCQFVVVDHENEYKKELELLQSGEIPVIGICLGFEMIVRAFGGKLGKLPHKETGTVEIEYVGSPVFPVENKVEYEAHRWIAQDLGENLVALARSPDGIEIVSHRRLPIMGFQFHPEFTNQPRAKDIIRAVVHSHDIAFKS